MSSDKNTDKSKDAKHNEEKELPHYRQPVLPDRELLLWEKWIEIRKEETARLGLKMRRPPVDLAMNLLKDYREDKERKTVLEQAQIPKKPKVRGQLWEQAPRLTQQCYCKPVYSIVRTREELGKPRIMEHISVPNYIQQTEMGMDGDTQLRHFDFIDRDYKKYKEEREEVLKNKILKIDPFRPTDNDILIKGEGPKPPPPKIPLLPEINIFAPSDSCPGALCGVYALRINNTVLFKEIAGHDLAHLVWYQKQNWHMNCTTWTYYFNVPMNKIGRAKLYLQNLGTITLRYCWKKLERKIPHIPEENDQVFYFNKNEDLISPGQSKAIQFTFITDRPGIFRERWEFCLTNVCFFEALPRKLIIYLCADSIEDILSMKRKVEILQSRINKKSLRNMAIEILNDVLDSVFCVPPQVYPYKKYFLEAEIFVMKNPVCFYHQTEVAKMSDLYRKMNHAQNWDLSIRTWRNVMMSKEYDTRMEYYDLLKLSHSELLKPWYEGDGLVKEKFRTIRNLLLQLAKKFDSEYQRIRTLYEPTPTESMLVDQQQSKTSMTEVADEQLIKNVFYMQMYEHVAVTIEFCAGILSSLDLDRWIEFDFCRTYNI